MEGMLNETLNVDKLKPEIEGKRRRIGNKCLSIYHKGTSYQNNVVCANAAMVIATVTACTPLKVLQRKLYHQGKGLKALTKLQELSSSFVSKLYKLGNLKLLNFKL
jgi:anthranilate phosphoribosyltransferase